MRFPSLAGRARGGSTKKCPPLTIPEALATENKESPTKIIQHVLCGWCTSRLPEFRRLSQLPSTVDSIHKHAYCRQKLSS